MSANAPSFPLLRERNLILAVLLVLAALAWATLIWQSGEVNDSQMGAVGASQAMADGSSMDEDAMAAGGSMEPSAEQRMAEDDLNGWTVPDLVNPDDVRAIMNGLQDGAWRSH